MQRESARFASHPPGSVPKVQQRLEMILAIFALCSFAASVSSRAVDPLTAMIAEHFSVAVTTAALLSSAYALPFALFQPVLGPVGDIWGKSRLLRLSLWILAFSLLAGAFAPSISILIVLRFIGGMASGGTVPSGMALIGDRFSGEKRQVALSRFVGAGLLGQIFSASAAGVLAVTFGWQAAFLVAGAITLVAAIIASIYLREPANRQQRSFSLAEAIRGYRMVFANPRAYLCFGTVMAEGIALWGVTPFIADLLITSDTGGTREAGIIIGGIGVGGVLFTLVLPMMLRTMGQTLLMAGGGVVATAGLIGLAMELDWMTVAALFAVTGFGYMMLHNSIQTHSVELAPTARSSAYSMHAFFFFTGQSLGPILFGLVQHAAGAFTALVACAILFAATGIIVALLFARLQRV
ncbi:MAG: MFS transporter [Hyphomicrobiaceae bacterium]